MADYRLLTGFSCDKSHQLLQHVLEVIFYRLRLPEENTRPHLTQKNLQLTRENCGLIEKHPNGRKCKTSLTLAWAPPSHPPFLWFLEREAQRSNPADTFTAPRLNPRSLPLLLMAVSGRLWFASTEADGPIENRGDTVRQVVGRREGT